MYFKYEEERRRIRREKEEEEQQKKKKNGTKFWPTCPDESPPFFFSSSPVHTHNTPRLKVGHCSVWRHQVFTRCMADAKGSSPAVVSKKATRPTFGIFFYFFLNICRLAFFFLSLFFLSFFLGILLLLLHPKDHLLFLLFSLIF